MKTRSFPHRPRLFQRVGSISLTGLRSAICGIVLALPSVTASAAFPWFSGYIHATNSYRIYACTDWDNPLYGPGINPDTDCLGVQPPGRRVDGHLVLEADGTGKCVVIEATGSFQNGWSAIGSVFPVSVQFGNWWSNPSTAPASDTRHDWDGNFLNIVSDPVGVLTPTNATPIPTSVALAGSTVAISWPTETNLNYRVMWTSHLTAPINWYFLGTAAAGSGATNTVYDSVNITNSSRFYRIIRVE